MLALGTIPAPEEYVYREYVMAYKDLIPPPTFDTLPQPKLCRGEGARQLVGAKKVKPSTHFSINDDAWRAYLTEKPAMIRAREAAQESKKKTPSKTPSKGAKRNDPKKVPAQESKNQESKKTPPSKTPSKKAERNDPKKVPLAKNPGPSSKINCSECNGEFPAIVGAALAAKFVCPQCKKTRRETKNKMVVKKADISSEDEYLPPVRKIKKEPKWEATKENTNPATPKSTGITNKAKRVTTCTNTNVVLSSHDIIDDEDSSTNKNVSSGDDSEYRPPQAPKSKKQLKRGKKKENINPATPKLTNKAKPGPRTSTPGRPLKIGARKPLNVVLSSNDITGDEDSSDDFFSDFVGKKAI